MTSTGVEFDHLSPEIAGPNYWHALRTLADHGPMTWVESNGGFWAATSYDTVLEVLQHWQTFTSTGGVSLTRPSFDMLPVIVPIELDPPRQRAYRSQVQPHLTSRSLAPLASEIRGIADELIDTFVDRGRCDIAVDFARKFPGTVLFRLVFHATDDDFRSAEPASRILSFSPNQQETSAAAAALRAWAGEFMASREAFPDIDDVVNAVMHLNDTDEEFVDSDLMSGLQILIQGGIGTSASAIGVTVRVLCEHPDLQEQVRGDLSLVPALVEECLRLETPLPLMFRTARHDVEVAGEHIKAGDKVGVFLGAANRDPAVFDRPDEVVLDRPHNRHLTFGAGPHRCVGSNLARLQIQIAMTCLLERLDNIGLQDGAHVEYFSLQARGPSSVPIQFDPVPA
ncbi:MAG: cytochrome P450 [Acidimicrobiia bacterium]